MLLKVSKLSKWDKKHWIFKYSNSDFDEIIKIDKSNSIKILEPSIYDEIRHFEIKIFNENNKLFYLVSDNYGEYTSINMDKTIDEEKLTQILDSIFIKKA